MRSSCHFVNEQNEHELAFLLALWQESNSVGSQTGSSPDTIPKNQRLMTDLLRCETQPL